MSLAEDKYRRAYEYLLERVQMYHCDLQPSNEMFDWMDDDIKNAKAIAGEDE